MASWKIARRNDPRAPAPGAEEKSPDEDRRARTDDLVARAARADDDQGEADTGRRRSEHGDVPRRPRPPEDVDARERELRAQLVVQSEAHQEALRRELEATERVRRAEHALDLSRAELQQMERTLAAERTHAASELAAAEQKLRA